MKSSKGTRKASTSSRSSSSAPSSSLKKSNELTRAERRAINQAEHRRAQAEREAQRLAAPKRRPARARVQVDTALGTFTEEVEGSAAMVKRVTGRAENKALAAVLVVGSALWAAPKVARWLSRR